MAYSVMLRVKIFALKKNTS